MSMSWDSYWAMVKLHMASDEKFFDEKRPKLAVLNGNFLAVKFHTWLKYESEEVQLEVVREAPQVALDTLFESSAISERVYNAASKKEPVTSKKHAHCHSSSATRAKRPKLVREAPTVVAPEQTFTASPADFRFTGGDGTIVITAQGRRR